MSDVCLPQVKKITLEIIPPFDYLFVRKCLKKKKINLKGVSLPEAARAMYQNILKTENKLLHLKSCCDAALNENILPVKEYLWNELKGYPKKNPKKILDKHI